MLALRNFLPILMLAGEMKKMEEDRRRTYGETLRNGREKRNAKDDKLR